MTKARIISLEQAKTRYPHRFTMQHIPTWANSPVNSGKFYAPQYQTDEEWYNATLFPGEGIVSPSESFCHSQGQTWPLGKWLNKAYRII